MVTQFKPQCVFGILDLSLCLANENPSALISRQNFANLINMKKNLKFISGINEGLQYVRAKNIFPVINKNKMKSTLPCYQLDIEKIFSELFLLLLQCLLSNANIANVLFIYVIFLKKQKISGNCVADLKKNEIHKLAQG